MLSDLAIVEFRRQMLDAVRDFQEGKPAIGTGDAAIPRDVCAYQAIIPKTSDWRTYPARYVWENNDGPALESNYQTSQS